MPKGKSQSGWTFKPTGDVNGVSVGSIEVGADGLSGEDQGTYLALLPLTEGDDAALTVTGAPVEEEGEVAVSENYNAVAGSVDDSVYEAEAEEPPSEEHEPMPSVPADEVKEG